jgi:hypothetical protein
LLNLPSKPLNDSNISINVTGRHARTSHFVKPAQKSGCPKFWLSGGGNYMGDSTANNRTIVRWGNLVLAGRTIIVAIAHLLAGRCIEHSPLDRLTQASEAATNW